MNEILLFCGLYTITLLFFAWAKAPKRIEMECPKCRIVQKKHIGDTCKCGKYLSWTDRISDARKTILQFEKMGLIKINQKDKKE